MGERHNSLTWSTFLFLQLNVKADCKKLNFWKRCVVSVFHFQEKYCRSHVINRLHITFHHIKFLYEKLMLPFSNSFSLKQTASTSSYFYRSSHWKLLWRKNILKIYAKPLNNTRKGVPIKLQTSFKGVIYLWLPQGGVQLVVGSKNAGVCAWLKRGWMGKIWQMFTSAHRRKQQLSNKFSRAFLCVSIYKLRNLLQITCSTWTEHPHQIQAVRQTPFVENDHIDDNDDDEKNQLTLSFIC